MGKSLLIAEKPSVAGDIAKALGGFAKAGTGNDTWYERDDVVIGAAVGHLVELAVSDEQNTFDVMRYPVIPSPFKLVPIAKSASRMGLLKKLMGRSDIDEVVNACDAGREGELIFRYIYAVAGCKKAMKRMWLQSMTPESIRQAFRSRRAGADYQGLFSAAQCRAEADFLFGINGSRILSALHERTSGGDRDKSTTGRVQGPTLAIIVDRENERLTFVEKAYWEVEAEFEAQNGTYRGTWFDAGAKSDGGEARPERIWDEARADEVAKACRGLRATAVNETVDPVKVAPQSLFDLTTLQREANRKYKFSAKHTLGIAQALYEKHKVLSYPRTDARALPDDYLDMAKQIMGTIKGPGTLGEHARAALERGYVVLNKRIFDSTKISDHFAIIPLAEAPVGLSADEEKIYELVAKRFVAAFYPHAQLEKTVRVTSVGAAVFKTTGSVMIDPGWKAVYGKEEEDEDARIAKVLPDEKPLVADVHVVSKKTKAPPRYTEATLLAAMENCGRSVEDVEMREAMAGKGIGTPATRANIIEALVQESADKRPYVTREKNELAPTAKGMKQVAFLRANGVAALTSAELTGEWELRLKQIEKGEVTRPAFMAEIVKQTHEIVERVRQRYLEVAPAAQVTLKSACPKCKGVVRLSPKMGECGCGFRFWREVAKRELTQDELETLISAGKVGPLDGFVSPKSKAKFSASLKFSEDFSKLNFEFDNAVSGPVLGACPKCGGDVKSRGAHFACESGDFTLYGEIAKRRIDAETAKQLLVSRRTDLLNGFKSKAGKNFSAYLVLQPTGKVEFQFEN